MLKNIRFRVNLTKSHEIVFTVSRGIESPGFKRFEILNG